jgi:hypothetical protein
MRAYLLILAGLPLLAQTETNIACVERLEIPAYPLVAKQARISGVLTATVLLGHDASVVKTSSEWDSEFKKNEPLFLRDVEKSLRASSFARVCADKAVRLVFHFVVAGGSVPSPQPPTISFGYPNEFWITVQPTIMQPIY